MTDTVSPAVRSQIMSRVRSKNTKPEILVRRGLHAMGFRYRLHRKDLPGKPDIVFPRYRAVILVHGCFWHGHDCALFRLPKTRRDWWRRKIERNRERDAGNRVALTERGWRRLEIWECAFRGRVRRPIEVVVEEAAAWLVSDCAQAEIRGLPLDCPHQGNEGNGAVGEGAISG